MSVKKASANNSTEPSWAGRTVTVFGLSRSGAAVAEYVRKRGGQVFLTEIMPASEGNAPLRRQLEAQGVEVEMGGHSEKCFAFSPLVVISPGIPPSNSTLQELKMSGLEVISEVEFAFRENQAGRNVPLIGITGTNGKTTTTTLISRILTQAGYHAPACGNIGIPLTRIVDEGQADFLVSELSSFQLEFIQTLQAKIAVFMNFTPDHLDWHGSLEAYERAKLKLFTGPEWSVCLAEDPVTQKILRNTRSRVLGFTRNPEYFQAAEGLSEASAFSAKIYTDSTGTVILERGQTPPEMFFNVHDLQIIGTHNHENVMAAVATAALLEIPKSVITEACLSFPGVEHRLEKVTVIPKSGKQIIFFNDSKATNVDAALSALRAFENGKIILIAGGRDKNTSLDPFVEAVKQQVSHTLLIGEAKVRFAEALRQAGYHNTSFHVTLHEAVEKAFELSEGEPVLFSPACSSFDMFKNFEDRGISFKKEVYDFEKQFILK